MQGGSHVCSSNRPRAAWLRCRMAPDARGPHPPGQTCCRAQYTNEIQYSANVEMERLLNQALGTVRDMLQRNRAALDAIIHALTSQGAGSLSGEARGPRLSQSCGGHV